MQGNWQNPNQPQQGYPQQQQQAPQPMPYQAPAAPPAGGGGQEAGFFGALFDFSFQSFVTLKFLKAVYGLFVVLIILAGLAGLYGAVMSEQYVMVLIVPIAVVLEILFVRMGLETFVLLFKFLQRKASGS